MNEELKAKAIHPKTKCTVKELREQLQGLPNDYEVILYQKYSETRDSEKYSFSPLNVSLQEPTPALLEVTSEYFGNSYFYRWSFEKHVAILF